MKRNYKNDLKINELVGKLNAKELIVPKYQRPLVWARKKKVSLIENILDNPKIYIPELSLSKRGKTMYLLDGKQRLSCLQEFIQSQFKLSKKFKNQFFHQLSKKDQNKILNFKIPYMLITGVSELDEIEIFQSINGGKPLNKEQLRKARICNTEYYKAISEFSSQKDFEQVFKMNLMPKIEKELPLLKILALSESTDNINFPFSKVINSKIEEAALRPANKKVLSSKVNKLLLITPYLTRGLKPGKRLSNKSLAFLSLMINVNKSCFQENLEEFVNLYNKALLLEKTDLGAGDERTDLYYGRAYTWCQKEINKVIKKRSKKKKAA